MGKLNDMASEASQALDLEHYTQFWVPHFRKAIHQLETAQKGPQVNVL